MLCGGIAAFSAPPQTVIRKDTDSYRLTITPTSRKLTKNGVVAYSEWGYKLSALQSDSGFGSDGWGGVSLLDREGFRLAGDVIAKKDLVAGIEYYGFLWVKTAEEMKVSAAQFKPLNALETREFKQEKVLIRKAIRELLNENGFGKGENFFTARIKDKDVQESYLGSAEDAAALLSEIREPAESPEPAQEPDVHEEERAEEDESAKPDVFHEPPQRVTNEDIQKALGTLSAEMEVQEK